MKDGTIVKIEYEGRLESGEVFDSSNRTGEQQPLTFEIGAHQVIPGFEKNISEMKKDEEKEFEISASDAYGEPKDELKQKVPRSALKLDQEPKEGMMLMLHAQNGQQIPGKIIKVDDENIEVDLNHPLAGKKLIFKVKLVGVEEKK